jgi:iron-sulfur cluster repair protein YtfE (RIC family)
MGLISDFQRADHERLSELFENFRKTKHDDLARASEMLSDFSSGLRNHIENEETLLFSLFEEKTGVHRINSSPTSTLRMEHVRILELLDKIESMIGKKDMDTDDVEERLAEMLATHDKEEVNIVYPWLDEVITSEEMYVLTEKIKGAETRLRR